MDYAPLLKWILVNTLAAFGVLTLWHFGVLQQIFESDRTRVSTIIFVVFVVTALHCLFQTVVVSRELVAARKVRVTLDANGGRKLLTQNGKILTADGKPQFSGTTTEHFLVGVGAILVGTSTARYRIYDGMRALDYLESRPEIDATRLGCTGCSGGGTLTSYLMALDPQVYMFDEPTAGMSHDEAPVILNLIRQLKGDKTKTILLVEHKMDVVRELSDRIIVLFRGEVMGEVDGEGADVNTIGQMMLGHALEVAA